MPRQRSPLNRIARSLRRKQTDAESRLWYHLRDRRLGGHKFRRQFPLGAYVADFVYIERRLILELDGGQHAERQEADERRTTDLEARGFRVLRFWNDQVLLEMDGVLESVRVALAVDPSPQPSPLERGEGEQQQDRDFPSPLTEGRGPG